MYFRLVSGNSVKVPIEIMKEQCGNSLLGSMATSLRTVEGVDTYLGWDPVKNVDTGWLMLKKGTKIDFSNMQLRDVNLSDLEEEKCSDDEVNKSFSSDITISTCSDEMEDGKNVHDEFMLDDESNLINTSLSIGMPSGVDAGSKSVAKEPSLNESEILLTEDISRSSSNDHKHLPVNSNLETSSLTKFCNFCLVDVDDMISHMSECLIKNAMPTERVSCPGCSKFILRKGLTTHLRISCRRKSVKSNSNNLNMKGSSQCTHCGVFIKDDFEQHADCISGEELAASIDRGIIFVRIKNNTTITEGAVTKLPDTSENEPDMQVSNIGFSTEGNDLYSEEREIEFSMF